MGHPGVPTTGAAAHVRGRWLHLAQWARVGVLALTLGMFGAGIPTIVGQLQTPCAGAGCYRWQPTPRIAADLTGHYQGRVAALRRSRHGLLLCPGPAEADLLGIRLPRTPLPVRPGSGWLAGTGGLQRVQVARRQAP